MDWGGTKPFKTPVFWRLARLEKRLDLGCATRNATPQAPCTELHGRYRRPKELARNAKNPGKTRVFERRGGDSNPRYGFPHTAFPVLHNRPLCHLSGFQRHWQTAEQSLADGHRQWLCQIDQPSEVWPAAASSALRWTAAASRASTATTASRRRFNCR